MSSLTQDTYLGGRYRLISRIAVGGMGEVWRAEDELLARHVAVKVLKSELTSDPAFLERFRIEARMTASLSHPGIASVHDYGEVGVNVAGTPDTSAAYLVMELVAGEPLSAILARSGRLATDWTLDIVEQAASALEAAHRAGMVHRDVKPGNLLVAPDGLVKITDFGIAWGADTVRLTQSGMVVGTAQYFSPEQAAGRTVNAASDVYSLGVVAYECLAGRLPFVADSPVTVAIMQIRDSPPPLPADIPPPVHQLVAQAMAKDPRQRFATGGQLAVAVRAVRHGLLQPPVPVTPPAGAGPVPAMPPVAGAPLPAGPMPGAMPGRPSGTGAMPGGPMPPPPPSTQRPSMQLPGGQMAGSQMAGTVLPGGRRSGPAPGHLPGPAPGPVPGPGGVVPRAAPPLPPPPLPTQPPGLGGAGRPPRWLDSRGRMLVVVLLCLLGLALLATGAVTLLNRDGGRPAPAGTPAHGSGQQSSPARGAPTPDSLRSPDGRSVRHLGAATPDRHATLPCGSDKKNDDNLRTQ
jgi:serine/threonine-protein kinase